MPQDGRRPGAPTLLAISLKMYFDPDQTLDWCARVAEIARTHPAVTAGSARLVVLPSLPVLPAVVDLFAGTPVAVGAQDLYWRDRGAYTGAVSGTDLRSIGCDYVEVGHSERRRLFGDDDTVVERKLQAAWRNDLIPVLCVGEAERGAIADAVGECGRQIDAAVGSSPAGARPLVVAYEPEWSIGADVPAPTAHIAGVTAALRDHLSTLPGLVDPVVIYGGAARDGMVRELRPAAGGLFLGRSVHDAAALKAILDETVSP